MIVPDKQFRTSASFGKRQEYIAVAELLRRGMDVYMTLVDDQQIDCIIRKEVRGQPLYIDVQIKARSATCKARQGAVFAAMEVRRPRRNFFFIFFSERSNNYWIVPSLELIKEARRNRSGKNEGCYSIKFANYSAKKDSMNPRARFDKYRNRFDLLEKWTG